MRVSRQGVEVRARIDRDNGHEGEDHLLAPLDFGPTVDASALGLSAWRLPAINPRTADAPGLTISPTPRALADLPVNGFGSQANAEL